MHACTSKPPTHSFTLVTGAPPLLAGVVPHFVLRFSIASTSGKCFHGRRFFLGTHGGGACSWSGLLLRQVICWSSLFSWHARQGTVCAGSFSSRSVFTLLLLQGLEVCVQFPVAPAKEEISQSLSALMQFCTPVPLAPTAPVLLAHEAWAPVAIWAGGDATHAAGAKGQVGARCHDVGTVVRALACIV
jgi:hypothetical protein